MSSTIVDISDLKGVAAVTGVYVFEYYVFLCLQAVAYLKVDARLKKKGWSRFDHSIKLWQMGDRTFTNIMEQAIPFFVVLWLHAIFIDARVSEALGAFYIGFRALYPFLWTAGNGKSPFILISTMPGYFIVCGFLASIVYTTLFDTDLPFMSNSSTAVRSIATFGMGFTVFFVAFLSGFVICSILDPIYQKRWKAQQADNGNTKKAQ